MEVLTFLIRFCPGDCRHPVHYHCRFRGHNRCPDHFRSRCPGHFRSHCPDRSLRPGCRKCHHHWYPRIHFPGYRKHRRHSHPPKRNFCGSGPDRNYSAAEPWGNPQSCRQPAQLPQFSFLTYAYQFLHFAPIPQQFMLLFRKNAIHYAAQQ